MNRFLAKGTWRFAYFIVSTWGSRFFRHIYDKIPTEKSLVSTKNNQAKKQASNQRNKALFSVDNRLIHFSTQFKKCWYMRNNQVQLFFFIHTFLECLKRYVIKTSCTFLTDLRPSLRSFRHYSIDFQWLTGFYIGF